MGPPIPAPPTVPIPPSCPCVGLVSPEEYAEDVRHSVMFLDGRSNALSEELSASMEKASMALEFERAAELRDQIAMLRRVQDQQSMEGGTGDVGGGDSRTG